MIARIALAAALSLPQLALAGSPVRFSDGAQVTLPDGYSHSFEDDKRTIVLYPKQKELFQYRLTFHTLVPHLAQRPRIAEEFVSSMAEKKGKQLRTIKGTALKGFLEAGNPSNVDGEPMRNMHGVVVMRQGYTTITLTVPEKYANDATVREFVGGGMEAILATLKYVGN
jgi:hypothetical protein